MDKPTVRSNSQYVITVLCLIIIAAVAYYVINPFVSELKEVNIKLSAKNNQINQTQEKIIALQGLQTQFNAQKNLVSKMVVAAPVDAEMPEILVMIQNMAVASGLRVSAIQPTQTSVKTMVPVTVSLQGNYNSFTSFLTKLENNVRPMNIKTINLALAQKEGSSEINSTLNLEILKAD